MLRLVAASVVATLSGLAFPADVFFDSVVGTGAVSVEGGVIRISGPVSDWSRYGHAVIDFVNNSYASVGDSLTVSAIPSNGVVAALSAPCHYPRSFAPNRYWLALGDWRGKDAVVALTLRRGSGQTGNLALRRVVLAAKGEAVGEPEWPAESLREVAASNAMFRAEASRLRADSLAAFRRACGKAGQRGGFCVGRAPASVQVPPRSAFSARPADRFDVRLARGERESFQVLVLPVADVREALVEACGNLASETDVFAASNLSVAVTGYVETKGFPPNKIVCGNGREIYPAPGWYPDPILDFMTSCPVAKDDVQSFWVRVDCPRNQPAGVYRGRIRIVCDGESCEFPLTVRVNDFELPPYAPCRLAINFQPGFSVPIGADPEYAKMCQWKRWNPAKWAPGGPLDLAMSRREVWVDFLADYGITYDRLYHSETNLPWAALERLKRQGRLGLFNLGVWGENPKYKDSFLRVIRTNHDEAKRHGLLKHAYIYGFDETPKSRFAAISNAIAEIKREFPDVPFLTTAFDPSLGVDESALSPVDWFTPSIRTNCFEASRVTASRAAGHKVWWYTCCFPHAPYPQLQLDAHPIETRLLMGAMAAKMKPDGFLYWQMAVWNVDRVIEGGPFTDWCADSYYCYHGDGSMVRIGPRGMPLSTQRLENFRDGLEDLWYARLLRRSGAEVPVPNSLVRTTAEFSRSPDELEKWRDACADALEVLQAKRKHIGANR